MIYKRLASMRAALVTALGFFVFACSHGGQETAGQSQEFSYLPIRLAAGAFDPLAKADQMDLPKEWTLTRYPEGETGYYIVQFKGPVLEVWKEAVVSAGGRLFDYIPKFAYIVGMNQTTRKDVEAMNSVRWIGVYQPGFRIAPDLRASLPNLGDQPVDIDVSVFPGKELSRLASKTHRLGGEVLDMSKSNHRLRVKIPGDRICQLSRLDGIKWIDKVPEFKLTPTPIKRSKE